MNACREGSGRRWPVHTQRCLRLPPSLPQEEVSNSLDRIKSKTQAGANTRNVYGPGGTLVGIDEVTLELEPVPENSKNGTQKK